MAGKRLTGKFSEEEYALIKEIQTKENVNDNQLVRGGIILLIYIALMNDFMNNSEFVKIIKPYLKDMNQYLQRSKVQQKLEKTVLKISKKRIKKIEAEAKLIEKHSRIFTKKRKVGRPKKKIIPKKPGRPKA